MRRPLLDTLLTLFAVAVIHATATAQSPYAPNPYRTVQPYGYRSYGPATYRPLHTYPPAFRTYRPWYRYPPAYWTYQPWYGDPYFGFYHQPGFEYRGSALPEAAMPGLRSGW